MMDLPSPADKPIRVSLTTSPQEFGFGQVSSAPPSPSVMTFEFDEPFPSPSPSDSQPSKESAPAPPLLRRLARNNLLNIRTSSLGDLSIRTHSPLRMSFSRRSISGLREKVFVQDESDSEREREKVLPKFFTRERSGSSPPSVSASSELPTPPIIPLEAEVGSSSSALAKEQLRTMPFRGPSRTSSNSTNTSEKEEIQSRRLSHSLKPPRLLSLLAESNPAENELQSEAQFQRLLAAYNGLPIGRPKSSRTISDRGRYPEEAVGDNDNQREDTPSEDEDEISNTAVGSVNSMTGPIAIPNAGGIFDDMPMNENFRTSPSGSVNGMDVDMPPPHLNNFSSVTASPVPWRHTPPPTACVSRPNKRKHDDRYDPYPSSAKRRAVSPSITALRESLSHAIGPGGSGIYSSSSSSSSIPIPRSPIVRSRDSNSMSISVASSPGTHPLRDTLTSFSSHSHSHSIPSIPLGLMSMSMSGSFGSLSRPISAVNSPLSSSPQQRPITLLASPVLRPIPRMAGASGAGNDRERERGQREVDGTGMAVSSLSLN